MEKIIPENSRRISNSFFRNIFNFFNINHNVFKVENKCDQQFHPLTILIKLYTILNLNEGRKGKETRKEREKGFRSGQGKFFSMVELRLCRRNIGAFFFSRGGGGEFFWFFGFYSFFVFSCRHSFSNLFVMHTL